MKVILSCLLLGAMAMTAAAADVTGKWSGSITPDQGNPNPALLILKQTGTQITGTAGPDESRQWAIEKGKIDGNNLTVEARDPNGNLFKLAMALAGDQIKGDVERTRGDGETQKAKIELTRVK